MKPSIGRIVHLVRCNPISKNISHIPAIIVAVWSDTCVNLQAFTDGSNSEGCDHLNVEWVTSVALDETGQQIRSWHWPERE